MSPASGDKDLAAILLENPENGFHSINVPSEWGPEMGFADYFLIVEDFVSIQLMSPASGDF
jgi:hypothetical protein